MFVSFGRTETWPSSDTADVETTAGVGKSALCIAHTPGLSGLHPRLHAGCSLQFLGPGSRNSCSSYVPETGDMPKEPVSYLVTHKWDQIIHPDEATYQDCFRPGRGQGWPRSIVVSAAGSRNPLYCWLKAPQCGMNQIPPASIRLHYSWIIIPKCTLMLKKSLLQNFKATIKYSIVMAQLNGLAWENWGL